MGDGMVNDGEIIEVLNKYLLNIITTFNTNRSIASNDFMLNSVYVQLGLFSLLIPL